MPVFRRLAWASGTKQKLKEMPDAVRDTIGYALHLAQSGGKSPRAKPLTGFKGAGVLEVVADHDGDTYRAVYTVRYADAVYVLHVFQKKSKRKAEVPASDMDLIEKRLKFIEQERKHKS
ncbi:type II toxin-antitoxin system RelE/ParE family toxin [Roseospira goensis]|uniref:Phage-related protein n=1 Tax=Roseospira goensis TaxID=391922 RepID=A0A7W6WKV9_9PROT|nr:type II toxin-antitoxin system RelE/ParE family toxin [Roseospira goensis]MBB4285767.1 phage-related protein [Roseospira goensis]